MKPEHSSEVTDKLLEMNVTELHKILLSPGLLSQRVTDAVQVLKGLKDKAAADEIDGQQMQPKSWRGVKAKAPTDEIHIDSCAGTVKQNGKFTLPTSATWNRHAFPA